jgi:phosphoglycolate phosphatase-like HAD superfamily hydrolase
MKKKIIFLDGDGTLWYPTKTLRTQKPHWIYHDEATKDNYLEHLTLAPGVKEALHKLYDNGIRLVVISANPYAEDIAVKEIIERLDYFGLTDLIYKVRSSAGDDPDGKASIILQILKELGMDKNDALMIGDSYFYDYLAAQKIGVDSFFIENEVSKMPEVLPKDLHSIKEVSDILSILE